MVNDILTLALQTSSLPPINHAIIIIIIKLYVYQTTIYKRCA